MKRLVLDLRSNPGGQLDQAIRIANRFVPKGSMIVYTRGRVPNSDQDYRATDNGDYLDLPMIMLVNRNSASASEIVSGALQDHDRALVIGETTFGKALVQSVYRVSQRRRSRADDRALLHAERPHDSASVGRHLRRVPHLHAARSGRAAAHRRPDEVHRRRPQGLQRRRHRARRALRRPDRGLQPDAVRAHAVRRVNCLPATPSSSRAEGDTRAGRAGQERARSWKNFAVDDAMVADFKQFVMSRKVTIDEDAWTKDKDFIRAMIRYEIDVAAFDIGTARSST